MQFLTFLLPDMKHRYTVAFNLIEGCYEDSKGAYLMVSFSAEGIRLGNDLGEIVDKLNHAAKYERLLAESPTAHRAGYV